MNKKDIPEKVIKQAERIGEKAKQIIENEKDDEKMFSKLIEMCIEEGVDGVRVIDEGEVRFDTISEREGGKSK